MRTALEVINKRRKKNIKPLKNRNKISSKHNSFCEQTEVYSMCKAFPEL